MNKYKIQLILLTLVFGIFAAACSSPAPVEEVAELPEPDVEVSVAEPTEAEVVPTEVPTDPPTEVPTDVPTEAPTNTAEPEPEPEPTEAEVVEEAEAEVSFVGTVPPLGGITEDVSFVTATGRPQFLNSYADW